jgi:glucose-6-phosphate isomerase
MLALLGVWYNNFLGTQTQAILPYSQYLRRFVAYIQQMDMESNGKNIDRNGNLIKKYDTGSTIWGEAGTDSQHSFYQLLHQGTRLIPAEFIGFASPNMQPELTKASIDKQHKILLANFFAQTQALMQGKTLEEVIEDLHKENKDKIAKGKAPLSDEEIEKLAPYKTFSGNRPTTTILMRELNPYTLGMLIAMYEHKVFTQGVIWNVYSFDQFGVELGKQLAKRLLNKQHTEFKTEGLDASTKGVIEVCKSMSADSARSSSSSIFPSVDPTKTKAWGKLKHLSCGWIKGNRPTLNELFAKDDERFANYSLNIGNNMFLDYSKNRVDDKVIQALLELAKQTKLISINQILRGTIQAQRSGIRLSLTMTVSV